MSDDQYLRTATNTLAIASLVCGLIWLGGLGSAAAIVLSKMAMREIDATGESGRGLAQVGLVLGICGLGFSFLMYGMAFLSFGQAMV